MLYVPKRAGDESDLVFSHLHFPWIPSNRQLPIVWNSQGISPPTYYARRNGGRWTVEDVAFVYRTLGHRAAALTIFTATCARNVAEWCPDIKDKIHVVPAPVFVDEGESKKPSESDGVPRILFVGADALRKGLPEIVDAAGRVFSRFPHTRMEIVSKPPMWLAQKINSIQQMRLTPSSFGINVKRMMSEADIFLLPTWADTYAFAAVEAMAHGCAVIISDLDPLPEVAPEGKVGFTVPPGDPEAIAESLILLLQSEHLLREMQRNAYLLYLERHHPAVVSRKLASVFEAVIK